MGLSKCLCVSAVCGLLGATPLVTGDPTSDLKKDLQRITDEEAQKWNCSFSISVKIPFLGPAINFVSDGITPDTKFVWGSITKMWTGSAIMQLVARGELKLDEPVAPLLDAQFARMKAGPFPDMNFTKISDLWGPNVSIVTIRNLISMQSGIPDFDTANPDPSEGNPDPFRAQVYANPTVDYSVPTLVSLPWVATHNLTSTPGKGFDYSTTNFELLGLILAYKHGITDYRDFNQSIFIPESYAELAKDVSWAVRGSPHDHGCITGYDRTVYNGQNPNKTGGIPVGNANGVFSGWSGADFVSAPHVVAELGYALWGKYSSSVLPKHLRNMCIPTDRFYGMMSQNVGEFGIASGDKAYGHLGATYGYDSIFGYAPGINVGITVATDIETPTQTQPSDGFCRVYNRVKSYIHGTPVEHCTWTTSGYYGGTCNCTKIESALIV